MTRKLIGKFAALILVMAVIWGCDVNRTTGQRTLTGSAAGAADGAAIGLIHGDFLGSALTGAAAGAASGFVYDQLTR